MLTTLCRSSRAVHPAEKRLRLSVQPGTQLFLPTQPRKLLSESLRRDAGRLENERVRLEAMISGSEKQLRFEYSRLTQEKGEQERIRQELRSLEPLRENTAQTVETLTKTCAELPALREELTAISDEGNV